MLCAAQLERSLGRLDDVSSIETSVAEEAAIVRLKSGLSFDLDKYRAAVKSAGQEAGDFELRLSAVVVEEDGRYSLRPGRGAPLPVRPQSAAKLKALVGRTVRASAKVLSSQRSPIELELTDIAAR